MSRVSAIREDVLVGSGSCSSIDECLTDTEVRDLLNELQTLLPLPEGFDGSLTEIGIKFKPK